jgi:hypothetical protein
MDCMFKPSNKTNKTETNDKKQQNKAKLPSLFTSKYYTTTRV